MRKSISIWWYSQTGSAYLCGQTAAEVLQDEGWTVRWQSLLKDDFNNDDSHALLLAFPVHNFQVPVSIARRLQAMTKLPAPRPAWALITYAGWAANTPWQVRRLLKQKNIDLENYALVKCRDSYIPFVKWLPFLNETEKPDQTSLAAVKKFVKTQIVSPGKRRRIFFNPLDPMHWTGFFSPAKGPKWFLGKRIFVAEDCVACGQCAALCPSGALTMEDNRPVYADKKCLGCCGCMNICPQNAWRSSWFGPEYYNKGLKVGAMVKTLTERHSLGQPK